MQPPFVIRRPVANADAPRMGSEPCFTIMNPAAAAVLDIERRLCQLERWLAVAADQVVRTGS